ncbi:hypothetical protein T190_31875 [Sinorhizobium meliloti CCBAU 01290]|nr:hypothetical protein T190_31875 [Sinorhizobium meliloti CCBAU 01290]
MHPWRSTRPLQDVAFLGDASQLLLQPPDLIGLVTTFALGAANFFFHS